MEHDLIDDLERRLHAARPPLAHADEHAFDAELLARVRSQPIAARRTLPRAVAAPVAVGVTLTAAAVVMLGGGPGDVGGPSSAAAITQALHWLDPPAGTILHARSVETMGGRTTIREVWQSADHPATGRERTEGAQTFETSGDAFYDAATNTIYDPPSGPKGGDGDRVRQMSGIPSDKLPAGDPIVDKVRILLRAHSLEVTGREVHNGTDAWAISLKPGFGRPVWTLWVSAATGKPLELRDPGRDASEPPQLIRWPAYEVLPGTDAKRLLTLTGAHPSARVVRDAARTDAAEARLMPDKPER